MGYCVIEEIRKIMRKNNITIGYGKEEVETDPTWLHYGMERRRMRYGLMVFGNIVFEGYWHYHKNSPINEDLDVSIFGALGQDRTTLPFDEWLADSGAEYTKEEYKIWEGCQRIDKVLNYCCSGDDLDRLEELASEL